MQTLTEKQRKVLSFMEGEMTAGRHPSLWKIANHFGWKSHTSAKNHIRALMRKGKLSGHVFNPDTCQFEPVERIDPTHTHAIP